MSGPIKISHAMPPMTHSSQAQPTKLPIGSSPMYAPIPWQNYFDGMEELPNVKPIHDGGGTFEGKLDCLWLC